MKYIFDFNNLTALDALKLASGDNWRVGEVVNKSIKDGLDAYKVEEINDIFDEFAKQYRGAFLNPLMHAIISDTSLVNDESK